MTAGGALLLAAALQAAAAADARLPARVRRIVLHVPGGPSYDRPERRWVFFAPTETQALWKPAFGGHWIVWIDGSVWPRHARPVEPASYLPPFDRPADAEWKRRVGQEATPVYSHLHHGNGNTVGIEVSHSGRLEARFPPEQVRSLGWLLRTLLDLSGGRLTPASIVGHKDVDERPAYVRERCGHPGCPLFVDDDGRPYRRRVDPPEPLFEALRREGLDIPRPSDGDGELVRAEALAPGERPRVVRQ